MQQLLKSIVLICSIAVSPVLWGQNPADHAVIQANDYVSRNYAGVPFIYPQEGDKSWWRVTRSTGALHLTHMFRNEPVGNPVTLQLSGEYDSPDWRNIVERHGAWYRSQGVDTDRTFVKVVAGTVGGEPCYGIWQQLHWSVHGQEHTLPWLYFIGCTASDEDLTDVRLANSKAFYTAGHIGPPREELSRLSPEGGLGLDLPAIGEPLPYLLWPGKPILDVAMFFTTPEIRIYALARPGGLGALRPSREPPLPPIINNPGDR